MNLDGLPPFTGDSSMSRSGIKKKPAVEKKVGNTRKRQQEELSGDNFSSSPALTAKTIRPKHSSQESTKTDVATSQLFNKSTEVNLPAQPIPMEVSTVNKQSVIENYKVNITNCLCLCTEFRENLDASKQSELVYAIALKLQDVLDNPKLHGQDVYFKKEISISISTENEPRQVEIPWTFYINVATDRTHALIDVNIPKSFLGKGTYKRVSTGHTVKLALQPHSQTESVRQARLRPAQPTNSASVQAAIDSSEIQEKIKNRMNELGLHVSITESARIREHVGKDGKQKVEMVMPLYKDDFKKISNYTLEQRLTRLHEVYNTVYRLNLAGVVHRDLKPENVLLDDTHAYLHDFDLAQIDRSIYSSSNYMYWDRGGQLGLVTHASDVVGAVLTSCDVLFYESLNLQDFDRYERDDLNQGFEHAFETLILPSLKCEYEKIVPQGHCLSTYADFEDLLQEDSGSDRQLHTLLSETKYKIELLKIFCDVLEQEDAYAQAIIGSCISYFSGKSGSFSEPDLVDDFNRGVYKWVENGLGHALLNKIRENIPLANLDDFLKLPSVQLTKPIVADDEERNSIEYFFSAAESLSNLLTRAREENLLPEQGDPAIFKYLLSKDAKTQAAGRQICFELFPTTRDLSESISRIPFPMYLDG